MYTSNTLYRSKTNFLSIIILMKKIIISLSLFILLAVVLSSLYFYYDSTHTALTRLRVEKISIDDEKIPESLNGIQILYFSDLHLFANDNDLFIERVFNEINDIDPDIILFGGDFIDASLISLNDTQKEFIETQLNKLNPKLGFFAVLGQDDRIQLDILEPIYLHHTIEVLENQAVLIRNKSELAIQLFGYASKNIDLDSSLYTLTLTYDPDNILLITSSDLVLAAKTHGGQVTIPFTGPLYEDADGDYVAGQSIVNKQHLIISNGISTLGYQARLFRDPSLYLFTLKSRN